VIDRGTQFPVKLPKIPDCAATVIHPQAADSPRVSQGVMAADGKKNEKFPGSTGKNGNSV
jgi:hypothetical protein